MLSRLHQAAQGTNSNTLQAECLVHKCRTRQLLHWLHGYVAEASSLQQIQQSLQQKKVCQALKGKLDGLGLKWL